jgi:hypothetical protein
MAKMYAENITQSYIFPLHPFIEQNEIEEQRRIENKMYYKKQVNVHTFF